MRRPLAKTARGDGVGVMQSKARDDFEKVKWNKT
jgi:hypothetical protein